MIVGDAKYDPLDKSVEVAVQKKLKGIVIFPEGNLPAGLHETLPIPTAFNEIIKRLQLAGKKVNIVPISLKNNYRTLNRMLNSVDPEVRTLQIKVHTPFTTNQIDNGNLNVLLRQIWFEDFRNEEGSVAGMPVLDDLSRRIETLVYSGQCEDILVN